MRPGQLAAAGRSSRSICAIGSLTKADAGTLTESFNVAPCAAHSSKSRIAVRMTRSVSASISASPAPGRNDPGADHAAVGTAGAHERFRADQTLGAQIDFGLVPQLEPVPPQYVGERHLAVGRFGLGLFRRE